MKTYIVRNVTTQHYEQKVEAPDPLTAQQIASEEHQRTEQDPIKIDIQTTVTPVELAYEG